jgi:Transposase DDE domain
LNIEAACRSVLHRLGDSYRYYGGRKPNLTDADVLTIEVFGEMCGHHTDASIWRYTDAHWRNWFPTLSGYKAFVKQSANLVGLKQLVFAQLFTPKETLHVTDGVPIPVCHYARRSRCKSFAGEASFGYCAAKKEKYYGFKGHVVIDLNQRIVGFTLTSANIDERDVLDNMRGKISGLLIGDKGLLSKSKQEELAEIGRNLQTALRDNMKDERSKNWVMLLKKVRRRVETAIGQLTEFYGFSHCKAYDMWHLTAKLLRKLIAYNCKLMLR